MDSTLDFGNKSPYEEGSITHKFPYDENDSLANMSALDDVRLGSVLQLEGSVADENSLSEREVAFANIWSRGSNKQKMKYTSPPQNNDGKHNQATNKLPL